MSHRLLFVGIPFVMAFSSASAFAQEYAPGASEEQPVGAAAAGGAYVPPADPTIAEVRPGPSTPPCTVKHQPCAYPHLAVAVDGGVSHFGEGEPFGFKTGTGSATSTGPAWGARFGAEFAPWFALEAHYIGMSNHAKDFTSVGGSRGLFTNALVAELRFTAPVPYVQPYLFVGGGVYSTSITGSSTSTQLTGSTEFGVPIGVGLAVAVCPGVSVGAELTYHRFFGESFSENEDIGGGEPLTGNAVVRVRL